MQERDFPGSAVIKTSPSNARGADLIPGQGAKILHAFQQKNKKQKTAAKNQKSKH